jgi:hypothetical protein
LFGLKSNTPASDASCIHKLKRYHTFSPGFNNSDIHVDTSLFKKPLIVGPGASDATLDSVDNVSHSFNAHTEHHVLEGHDISYNHACDHFVNAMLGFKTVKPVCDHFVNAVLGVDTVNESSVTGEAVSDLPDTTLDTEEEMETGTSEQENKSHQSILQTFSTSVMKPSFIRRTQSHL